VAPDNPTEEAIYGDLDVTREGPGGPFRIVFHPMGQHPAPSPGCTVKSTQALSELLSELGLSSEQITKLSAGLENSPDSWIRVLAATALLKQYSLI